MKNLNLLLIGFLITSQVWANDPLFHLQWGYSNPGGKHSHLERDDRRVETQYLKGADIGRGEFPLMLKRVPVVAVLDTGLDLRKHPELKHAIYLNEAECFDGEPYAADLQDLDKNGLAGDCHGWNFTAKDPIDSTLPMDEDGHGTHVAGIIAAKANNGIGIMGILDEVKILPIKVFTEKQEMARPYPMSLAMGIRYATKMKVDVINLSIGVPNLALIPELRQAIEEALKAGVTIVAAAGNDRTSKVPKPCSLPGVICVGATEGGGKLASFSNYGGQVDVMAPGAYIISTFPMALVPQSVSEFGYEVLSGTSQAAPMVSAVVAAIKATYPGISNDEVYARLAGSANKNLTPGAALNGMVHLERALNISPRPLVRPDFKGLDLIQVKGNGAASFKIKIKNYWNEAHGVCVELTSSLSVFKFEQERHCRGHLGQGETWVLNLPAHLSDLNTDSRLDLKVAIESEGEARSIYHMNLGLVMPLQEAPTYKQVALLKSVDKSLALQSVTMETVKKQLPEFFTFKDGQLVLRRVSGTDYKELPLTLDAQKIIDMVKTDLDLDGREDYLIMALKDSKLTLSYLKTDLSSLFSNGTFVLENKLLPRVTFERLNFAIVTFEGRKIKVPFFMTNGLLAKSDLHPNSLEVDPLTRNLSRTEVKIIRDGIEHRRVNPEALSKHLYYFSPLTAGQMQVRAMDDHVFYRDIYRKLKLTWGHRLFLLNTLSTIQDDSAQYLLATGTNRPQKYFILNVGKDLVYEILPLGADGLLLEGATSVPVLSGSASQAYYGLDRTFVIFRNSNFAEAITKIDGKWSTHQWELKDLSDGFQGVLTGFEEDGSIRTFLQTENRVVEFNAEMGEVASYPVNKTSFINNMAMKELWHPVVTETDGKRTQGFYVDATQLNFNHQFVVEARKGRLVSPVKFNVIAPQGCEAKNPTFFEGVDNLVFLCPIENGFELKMLPLK